MVLLCLVWGIGHVAAKFAAFGISLVFQAGLRSLIAAALLLIWVHFRRIPLWERDGTLWPGIWAGLLFAGEFVFIYAGLALTDAARMVVFVYLAPCMTAFGLHFLIPQERLNVRQWAGILLAFLGIALAFGDAFASGRSTLLGDFYGLLGAVFWAATTVLIRASKLSAVSAPKTLFYQLAVSAPVLLAASWLMDESGVIQLTPYVIAAFLYQCIAVAFASYLAWFWLLRHYLAAAAVLVGLGIYLVNLRS